MKLTTARQIENLISITPDIPENQQILQQLDYLANSLDVVEQPYTYTNSLVVTGAAGAIAAGVTSTPVITNVDAAALFVIENQTYMANLLNAAQTEATQIRPGVNIMISDTGTSQQWYDNPVPIPTQFGDGRFAYFLAKPRIVPANAQISVTYTNTEATNSYNLRLCFNGYRLFSYGKRGQNNILG